MHSLSFVKCSSHFSSNSTVNPFWIWTFNPEWSHTAHRHLTIKVDIMLYLLTWIKLTQTRQGNVVEYHIRLTEVFSVVQLSTGSGGGCGGVADSSGQPLRLTVYWAGGQAAGQEAQVVQLLHTWDRGMEIMWTLHHAAEQLSITGTITSWMNWRSLRVLEMTITTPSFPNVNSLLCCCTQVSYTVAVTYI